MLEALSCYQLEWKFTSSYYNVSCCDVSQRPMIFINPLLQPGGLGLTSKGNGPVEAEICHSAIQAPSFSKNKVPETESIIISKCSNFPHNTVLTAQRKMQGGFSRNPIAPLSETARSEIWDLNYGFYQFLLIAQDLLYDWFLLSHNFATQIIINDCFYY